MLNEINDAIVAQWGGTPELSTDKGTNHDYINFYQELFTPYKKGIRLLEVGVSSGGSLLLWSSYFDRYSINAIDINKTWVVERPFQQNLITDTDIHIAWGKDSTDPQSYSHIEGAVDVVIDDGDHRLATQQRTMLAAWPKLKQGGAYVIEDLESLRNAQLLVQWISNQYPGQLAQIFVGSKHPARQDDIIVWTIKQ